MEQNTLIKLRQFEANEVSINGSFKVSLSESVLLEEGDEVRVHSVILDTASESVISIDKDLDIRMGVGKYTRNFNHNQIPLTMMTPSPTAFYRVPDFRCQILCQRNIVTGANYELGWLIFVPHNDFRPFGDCITNWEVTPVNGGPKETIQITINSYKGREHRSKNAFQGVGELFGAKSFRNTDSSEYLRINGNLTPFTSEQNVTTDSQLDLTENAGWAWANGGNTVPTGGSILSVREEFCNFTLPAGNYEPAELAQIINDEMVQINKLGITGLRYANPPPSSLPNIYPIDNPFLSTMNQQLDKITTEGFKMVLCPEVFANEILVPGVKVPTATFLSDGAASLADDRFIGSSQISMNYDTNLNKLNFDAMHMPVYVSPGGSGERVPGITFPDDPATNQGGDTFPALMQPQINLGGTFFTTLEPADFWQTTLGFGDILVDAELVDSANEITLDDTTVLRPLIIKLVPGKNIIGALSTIDSIVDKGASTLVPVTEPTENSLTTPIIASRTFNQTLNNEGYYLLEVGVNFPQKMIGGQINGNTLATNSNKVQSIITKYYTSGNFLQDTGSGSIAYTHVGQPQLISDIDIRVVHPDGSQTTNTELGPKNSVFLEVVKAFKPQYEPIESASSKQRGLTGTGPR